MNKRIQHCYHGEHENYCPECGKYALDEIIKHVEQNKDNIEIYKILRKHGIIE